MEFPVSKLKEEDGQIVLELKKSDNSRNMNSQEIIGECLKYEAHKVVIYQNDLHVAQLVHDITQVGYKVMLTSFE